MQNLIIPCSSKANWLFKKISVKKIAVLFLLILTYDLNITIPGEDTQHSPGTSRVMAVRIFKNSKKCQRNPMNVCTVTYSYWYMKFIFC